SVSGLSRVSATADARIEALTHTGDTLMHHEPVALADGKTVLYTSILRNSRTTLGVATVSTGQYFTLDLPVAAPVGVIDGALLYIDENDVLMAAPYDASGKRVTGAAVRVSDDLVDISSAAVANDGTLAAMREPTENEIVLVDMHGVAAPFISENGRTFASP